MNFPHILLTSLDSSSSVNISFEYALLKFTFHKVLEKIKCFCFREVVLDLTSSAVPLEPILSWSSLCNQKLTANMVEYFRRVRRST